MFLLRNEVTREKDWFPNLGGPVNKKRKHYINTEVSRD